MDSLYANYSPGTANIEYQERLRNQRMADEATAERTPLGCLAAYKLTERTPVWKLLLDVEKPHLYSTKSIIEAIDKLDDPEFVTPCARAAHQRERFVAVLATRI